MSTSRLRKRHDFVFECPDVNNTVKTQSEQTSMIKYGYRQTMRVNRHFYKFSGHWKVTITAKYLIFVVSTIQ